MNFNFIRFFLSLINYYLSCIKAAEFETNFLEVKKLLMAASFGKAFLGADDIDHNILKSSC